MRKFIKEYKELDLHDKGALWGFVIFIVFSLLFSVGVLCVLFAFAHYLFSL